MNGSAGKAGWGRLAGGGLFVIALAGFCLNLYLLWIRVADGGIAGCGGDSCEQVLASRWAEVFGVPITVFGAVVYAWLMVSLAACCRRLVILLLGVIFGAGFWFILVQALILGKFCPWCLATHGVGLAAVVVGGIRERRVAGFSGALKKVAFWGYSAFLMLGLVQVYGPVPATHRIIDSPTPAAAASVQVSGDGRKVSFDGGRKTFDVSALPRLGLLDAKHVMVEYFDFQCPSCRIMSGYLSALVEKHPAEVCVLLMPVPLDPVCNEAFVPGDVGHPDSCKLTRIALAVWRENPTGYLALHRAFLSDPPPLPNDALALAQRQVPRAQLTEAMADPWIDELIHANVADWVSYSSETKKLPKLLIRDKRILHGLPSDEADFIRVMERELGL